MQGGIGDGDGVARGGGTADIGERQGAGAIGITLPLEGGDQYGIVADGEREAGTLFERNGGG